MVIGDCAVERGDQSFVVIRRKRARRGEKKLERDKGFWVLISGKRAKETENLNLKIDYSRWDPTRPTKIPTIQNWIVRLSGSGQALDEISDVVPFFQDLDRGICISKNLRMSFTLIQRSFSSRIFEIYEDTNNCILMTIHGESRSWLMILTVNEIFGQVTVKQFHFPTNRRYLLGSCNAPLVQEEV